MVGGWIESKESPKLELDLELLQQFYALQMKEACEVSGCKLPMHLIFYKKKVCFGHWSEDWKSINLKKVFGISEESEITIEHLKKKGLGV
jgi:uncharacterized protein YvpB